MAAAGFLLQAETHGPTRSLQEDAVSGPAQHPSTLHGIHSTLPKLLHEPFLGQRNAKGLWRAGKWVSA